MCQTSASAEHVGVGVNRSSCIIFGRCIIPRPNNVKLCQCVEQNGIFRVFFQCVFEQANRRDVLLLDEPVTGLDLTSREIILDLIDDEVESGRTVIVTTHSLEEARLCNFVLLLDTEAIAFGTPDEVLTEAHLRQAFGGGFIRVGDDFILDDPHHHSH